MTAWLMSPYFIQDLELIYSLHLMTTQEWKNLLSVVYHPLLNKSYSNKIKYEKNFNKWREYDLLTCLIALVGLALSMVDWEFADIVSRRVVGAEYPCPDPGGASDACAVYA